MSENTTCSPGAAIRSIAYVAGIGDVEAALAIAASIGGIAGPRAKIAGPAGEPISPGINLIVAGADAPSWCRAQDLILDPLMIIQRNCRDMSSAVNPERLDHLQYSRIGADETDRIVEAQKDKSLGYHGDPHFAALRHPSFLLRNPDPVSFPKLLNETLDNSALVLFPEGQLISELVRDRPTKKWMKMASLIAAMITGTDSSYTPAGKQGPGRIATLTGKLFTTCTQDQLRDAVGSGDETVQQILRNSILLDCPVPVTRDAHSVDHLREGYKMFYCGVESAIKTRRGGGWN